MTDYLPLLERLHNAGAQFIVIGGVAGIIHGAARVTYDTDILYERSPANLRAIVAALAPLTPYPRGAPPGLPFLFDERTLRAGLNFTFSTTAGDIDLLGAVDGVGPYENAIVQAAWIEVSGKRVAVLSLIDLIAAKRAAGRPKDFEAIAELEILRDEIENR